jgi:hypothetical protein
MLDCLFDVGSNIVEHPQTSCSTTKGTRIERIHAARWACRNDHLLTVGQSHDFKPASTDLASPRSPIVISNACLDLGNLLKLGLSSEDTLHGSPDDFRNDFSNAHLTHDVIFGIDSEVSNVRHVREIHSLLPSRVNQTTT